MKALKIILLAVLVGLIAVLTIGLGTALAGNGVWGFTNFSNKRSGDVGKLELTSKGTMDLTQINQITIRYKNDLHNIEIYESQDNQFHYEEYSDGTWKEETRFYQENEELILENEQNQGVGIFNFSFWKTSSLLKVYIPSEYKESIAINAVNADIYSFFSLEQGTEAKVQIATVSGDVQLEGITAKAVEISCVSGDIEAEKIYAEMTLNTVSGDIKIEDALGEGSLETVSGSIEISCKEIIGDISLLSVSGDVRLEVPKDAAFELDADTTSGDISSYFESQISLNERENKGSGIINGNSENKIDISTISGDIEIPGRD